MYAKSDRIRKMLGENIKRLRISRGYTQEKFAKACDKSQAVISSWEIGVRQPELDVIFELADAFHVPVTALIPVSVSGENEDIAKEIASMLQTDRRYRLLFDKAKNIDPDKLDVILNVMDAVSGNDHD